MNTPLPEKITIGEDLNDSDDKEVALKWGHVKIIITKINQIIDYLERKAEEV